MNELHPKVVKAREVADRKSGGCIFAISEAVAAAQREVDAERVPTSWLDPLLSSPEAEALAKKSSTMFVEHLLRAVRDRIRKGD